MICGILPYYTEGSGGDYRIFWKLTAKLAGPAGVVEGINDKIILFIWGQNFPGKDCWAMARKERLTNNLQLTVKIISEVKRLFYQGKYSMKA